METLRFWGYLGAAALLAALTLIVATAAAIADSTVTRILVAFAIPVLAGLAVTGSTAATEVATRSPRRKRRAR